MLTRSVAQSPLTLLAPRSSSSAAWVICGSHGGGLVAGDRIRLDVTLREGSVALIGTQASTKVYRSENGLPCRQEISARVGPAAALVWAPDAVTCFAGAIYEQRQRIDVSPSASLVLVDWLTSGRMARGERWAFAAYRSRTDVFVAGRHVLRDAMRLERGSSLPDVGKRAGSFDCLATIVLLGAGLSGAPDQTLSYVASQPVRRNADVIFGASPLPGGAVVRVAGRSTAAVMEWMIHRLAFVKDITGVQPWARKS